MSSCDNSNIKQNYIVTNTNEFDTLTACTGIWTSNIYGCSPITVQDPLKLNVVSNNNTLNRLLVIDNTGLIEYRDVNTIASSGETVNSYIYNNQNTFIIGRADGVQLSATFNTVTGLTVNGNLFISGNTETSADLLTSSDGISDIGSPIKRFRKINTLSGTSTVWTSTNKVITPQIDLGLDVNNNSRVITANNSIIQNDILNGGTF